MLLEGEEGYFLNGGGGGIVVDRGRDKERFSMPWFSSLGAERRWEAGSSVLDVIISSPKLLNQADPSL